jgi:Mg-chelatase subunit ChlD
MNTSNIIFPVRQRLAATFAIAMLCLSLVIGLGGAQAQSANPTPPVVAHLSGEVKQASWSLKPQAVDVSEWTALRLNFLIERTDRARFGGLTISAIKAALDGQPIQLNDGDLVDTSQQPVSVLLLLDGSGSMNSAYVGTSKLAAAKQALLTLVEKLGPNARIGIAVFDKEQRLLAAPTSDKAYLRSVINNFTTAPATRNGTALYDAAEFALQVARQQGLQNIVLLSDGCEDTAETKRLARTSGITAYKRERERQITEGARQTNIRLFTVAIGDKDSRAEAPLFVDSVALHNLTLGAAGGFSGQIDLPRLQRLSGGDGAAYRRLLVGDLSALLERIRESFRFDYSLRLRLGSLARQDGQSHKVTVRVVAGNHELPVEIPFVWQPGARLPEIRDFKALPAVLIRTPLLSVQLGSLLQIYLALTLALAALAVLPPLRQGLRRLDARRKNCRAVVVVKRGSQLIGCACPNEGQRLGKRYLLREGDLAVLCPQCGTPHHLNCWQLNEERCWIRTCGHEMLVEEHIESDLNERRAA